MTREATDALLAAVERLELRSLSWGFVDGSIKESELVLLAGASPGHGPPEELTRELVAKGLIFEVGWDLDGVTYRSRFAETVRLLVRLRQITKWNSWDVAPQLVADYRIDARPRPYAPRTISVEDAIGTLRQARRWDPFRENLLRSVASSTGLLLSRFQLSAAHAIHDWSEANQGVVITAGTGSGKTIAYYLPVMIETAALARAGEFWVKGLSIYPRVELLKDQFSEAVKLASNPGFLSEGAGRRLRLGAFFGGTPRDAAALDRNQNRAIPWPTVGAGRRCPYLRCPAEGCDGDVVWLDADRRTKREVLTCTECGWKIGTNGELALTRETLQSQPPDLLFTTAEMVNQRLSDPAMRPVLGITSRRDLRARFLLLDEVHTYEGVLGAQIGAVVRRWRHAIGRPVLVAGLSATLKDAPDFMADLTGIRTQLVQEVSPRDEDLAETSMSYQLVLRADATTRTAVLSTTIQAAFLLARMLDQADSTVGRKSDGQFGSRLFVFTDTLDVTNRLYDDLVDAERGAAGQPLASYRSPGHGNDRIKRAEGQTWESAELLQGSLARRLHISRTSSQDSGVDAKSEIVVATSSLEVGYNDPRVGAVIQHRAPHDHATFLQRRGRAGRSLEMRPWMVTVLSEYGPDRTAYQMYEQLLEPTLQTLRLPIGNRYVQRIQSTHALLDWLSLQLPQRGWIRAIVDGPKEPQWRRGQTEVLDLLNRLLAGDESLLRSLRDHVKGSLQLDDEDAEGVMWSPPRSLMLEVVPTLRRRLATNWVTGGGASDLARPWQPLPDFVPSALFSDLSLPEVTIVVPDVPELHSQELMPVGQMLRELAPGRVTRRFAVIDARTFVPKRGQLSHWIPPGDPGIPDSGSSVPGIAIVDLEDWMVHGDVVGEAGPEAAKYTCYRPWEVQVSTVPPEVAPTSHGTLDWKVQFSPLGEPVALSVPSGAGASALFDSLDLFIHSHRNPVTVFRYATGGQASIRVAGSREERRFGYRFRKGADERVGLGFALEVDALRGLLQVPDRDALLTAAALDSSAGQMSEYFRDALAADHKIGVLANRFEVQWLGDAVLLAVGRVAASELLDRPGVIAAVRRDLFGALTNSLELMLAAGMGVPDEDPITTVDNATQGANARTRLADDLRGLLSRDELLTALDRHLGDLAQPDPDRLAAWLRFQFIEAAAGALLNTAVAFLPDQAGADILALDVTDAEVPEVWITETTLGGGGAVEAIGIAFAEDPWRFARAFEATLADADSEIVASALRRTVSMLATSEAAQESAQALRTAVTHRDRARAQVEFNRELASHGIPVDRSIAVAINQRLMRPGADAAFDAVVAEADEYRIQLEARLGLALDLRLMTLVLVDALGLGDRLISVFTGLRGQRPTRAQVAATLSGIMWPSLAEVRRHVLETYSPFRSPSRPDPRPLRMLIRATVRRVSVGDDDARNTAAEVLSTQGVVELAHLQGDPTTLIGLVREMLTVPITLDFLRLYASLAGIRGEGDVLVARLEVRELG